MDTSIVIFVMGVLLSVISWMGKKMFNQIIGEIKATKAEVTALREDRSQIKLELQSLPCKNVKNLKNICAYSAPAK